MDAPVGVDGDTTLRYLQWGVGIKEGQVTSSEVSLRRLGLFRGTRRFELKDPFPVKYIFYLTEFGTCN